jgi:FixJ family two-component response regulator
MEQAQPVDEATRLQVRIDGLIAVVALPAIWTGQAPPQAASTVLDLRWRYESLTRRQRDVMALVVAGLLNKQIAGELGTSEVTVKVRRARVMQKVHADSVADLVRAAERLKSPVSRRPRPPTPRYR